MDELLAILNDLHSDIDFTKETDLFGRGLLDSFDIVALISEISMQFGVQISPGDIKPDNFSSADSIHALIERIREEV